MTLNDLRKMPQVPAAVTWDRISGGAVFSATVGDNAGVWLKLGDSGGGSLYRLDYPTGRIANRWSDSPKLLEFIDYRELNAVITVTEKE